MSKLNQVIKLILASCIILLFIESTFSNGETCSRNESCNCGEELVESKQLNTLFDTVGMCKFNGITITNDNIRFDCYDTNISSNTQWGDGVRVENANNVTIRNCKISGYYNGINIINSTNIKLYNITAINNYGSGVKLNNSNNNVIQDSELSNNSWDGVFLINSSNNEIVDNQMHFNSIDGIQIYHNSYNNWIENNDLRFNYGHAIAPIVCNNEIVNTTNRGGRGEPIIYYENAENIDINENNEKYSEIILCSISDFTISNININNSFNEKGDGVLILHSKDGRIEKSVFNNVRTGIYLYNTTDIDIEENQFKNSQYGVRVYENSDDIHIVMNDFYGIDIPLDVINSSDIKVVNALINNKNYDISFESLSGRITEENEVLRTQGEVEMNQKSRTILGEINSNLIYIGVVFFSIIALIILVYLIFDYLKFRHKYNFKK